ncbi:MAG: LysR family transcriptional regulator [Chloroflexota bacterium]
MNERHEAPAFPFHAQQLACLREVERAGTFTAAADRLGVSQPALSQSLADLERRLGVPLFERQGRLRVLTEAGREAARFASEVLGRAEDLRGWIDAYRDGAGGTLAVGMIDAASLYAFPEAVRAFREAYPGVTLRLVVDASSALAERLRRYELDLAILVGPAPADLDAVEVAREPLHIYAPAGASGAAAEADWVLYPAASHTRAQIEEGLARLGITPRVVLESGNPEVLRQMVALGFGWSVLPAAVADAERAGGVEQRQVVAERTLLGVRRPGAASDPRAEAFLRLARAHAWERRGPETERAARVGRRGS